MHPTLSMPLQKSITLAQHYTSPWFYLSTSIQPPSSPYAISLNPTIYAKKYYCIHLVRKQKLFRLRDSPLASLFRMYEMLLCGLNQKVEDEARYFWDRKWRISSTPNPCKFGWERDLDRDRICQLIVIQLIEAFNYYKFNRQTPAKGIRTQKLPSWANTLDPKGMDFSDIYKRFPGLQKIYFFLPWTAFLKINSPCNPSTIHSYYETFTSNYIHWPKMHSLPLFHQKDTLLSSFFRLYELKMLSAVEPETHQIYQWEFGYLLRRWGETKVADFPDPRSRWGENEFKWEKEMWREFVVLVTELAGLEVREGRGLGLLPRWACSEEDQDERTIVRQVGGPQRSDGRESDTTFV